MNDRETNPNAPGAPPRPPVPEQSREPENGPATGVPVPPAPASREVRRTVPPPPPLPPTPAAGPRLRKSPALAVILSFFTGLGHLYLGLYQRGIVFFALFTGSIALASEVGELGVLVPFVWFFGVIDAYRQAQLINLGGEEEPTPASRGQSNLGFGVFLTVLGGVLLLNKFYPIDFRWIREWWPLALVLLGLYLIGSAWYEKKKQEEEARLEPGEDEPGY